MGIFDKFFGNREGEKPVHEETQMWEALATGEAPTSPSSHQTEAEIQVTSADRRVAANLGEDPEVVAALTAAKDEVKGNPALANSTVSAKGNAQPEVSNIDRKVAERLGESPEVVAAVTAGSESPSTAARSAHSSPTPRERGR